MISHENREKASVPSKRASVPVPVVPQEEEAGVHFRMHIQSDCTEAEIVERVKAGGVKLDPLSRYYVKDLKENVGKEDARKEDAIREHTKKDGPWDVFSHIEKTFVMNYSSVNMENTTLQVLRLMTLLGK